MATKLKIKKNDQVLVISGRDKGKRGRVIEVNTQTGRVVVEGINMMKKAVRPNRQRGIAGGIVEREAPINVSNCHGIEPGSRKPTRSAIRSCRMDAKSAWRAKRAPRSSRGESNVSTA